MTIREQIVNEVRDAFLLGSATSDVSVLCFLKCINAARLVIEEPESLSVVMSELLRCLKALKETPPASSPSRKPGRSSVKPPEPEAD